MMGFGLLDPSKDGETDAYGNIMLRHGLSGSDLVKARAHELEHRALSPGGPDGLIKDIRAGVGESAYNNSHLIKYLEEARAEWKATRDPYNSLFVHPWDPIYELNPIRLPVEAALLAGGSVYAGNSLGNFLGNRFGAHR
jgi:hypothetical protein